MGEGEGMGWEAIRRRTEEEEEEGTTPEVQDQVEAVKSSLQCFKLNHLESLVELHLMRGGAGGQRSEPLGGVGTGVSLHTLMG